MEGISQSRNTFELSQSENHMVQVSIKIQFFIYKTTFGFPNLRTNPITRLYLPNLEPTFDYIIHNQFEYFFFFFTF